MNQPATADELPAPESPPKPGKNGRRPGSRSLRVRAGTKLDFRSALRLRVEGVPVVEIARRAGVTEGAVYQALRPFRSYIEARERGYDQLGTDEAVDSLMNAALGLSLQNMASPALHAAASLRDEALAFDRLHSAIRLRRGQTTANVGLAVVFTEAVGAARRAPDRPSPQIRTDEHGESTVQAPRARSGPPRLEHDAAGGSSYRNEPPPRGVSAGDPRSAPVRSERLAGGETIVEGTVTRRRPPLLE